MSEVVQVKDQWENQYESGQWAHLHDYKEFAHYTIVAGYIQKQGESLSLLDVGCGEGVVLKYLNLDSIASYTGVDLAQAALNRISPKRSQDQFFCSSLEEFIPRQKWDVILFNEVLYYTRDPVAQIKKFEQALTPRGCFVISMYQKPNPMAWNNRCIRKVARYVRRAGYVVQDGVKLVKSDNSAVWQISVVRPGGSGESVL